MRDRINVLYYPSFYPDYVTLAKAILFFDEIHIMDRPSFSFDGGVGTIGMDSPLRQFDEQLRRDGVPLYVHKPTSGRVRGGLEADVTADVEDPEFLRRFQNGIVKFTSFRDLHIAPGRYGDPSAPGLTRDHGEVAAYLGSLDLTSSLGDYSSPVALLRDSNIPPYAVADPISCAKTLIFMAAACSATINHALYLSTEHGFVPLADVPSFAELVGAKYARTIKRLELAEFRIPVTDLTFSIFDELVPSGLLEKLDLGQIIRYRAASEHPREAFLEYVTSLQSRIGRIGPDANYADSVGKLVRDEILPASRAYGNKMRALGDQLFGTLAKGVIGAASTVSGIQVLGDISLHTLLTIGSLSLASAYIGNATVDAIVARRAVNRDGVLSYLLSLNR